MEQQAKPEKFSPSDWAADVEEAEETLQEFAEQFSKGAMPDASIADVLRAVETMWIVASGPKTEILWPPKLGRILETDKGISYGEIVRLIPEFIKAMNDAIEVRAHEERTNWSKQREDVSAEYDSIF